MVREMWLGLKRFWSLSWWWKAPILGFVAFLTLSIGLAAAGVGDDDGETAVSEATQSPTAIATLTATSVSTPTETTAAAPPPTTQPTPVSTPTPPPPTPALNPPPTAAPTPPPAPALAPPPTAPPTPAPPTPAPTVAPPPPTPVPTVAPPPSCQTNAPPNPYGYDFCFGDLIYSPPGDICSYIACIGNFWNGRGHVIQCRDGTFSKSGGIQGSCSHHGGNAGPLYSH